MHTVKVITTAFNIIFALIFLWFCRPLAWNKTEDRYGIVGFGCMITLYIVNTVLIWM